MFSVLKQKPARGKQPRRNHTLMRGLVMWYIMNEGTGNSIFDYSGYGNNGSFIGIDPGADWLPGRSGFAIDLDGSNDRIECGTDSSMNVTGDMTLSIWCKKDDTTYDYLFTRYNACSDNQAVYALQVNTSGEPLCVIANAAGNGNVNGKSTTAVNDGAWHHVAVRVTGVTIEVWVDGVLGTSPGTITAGRYSAASAPTLIGDINGCTTSWHGQVDDARIYNRALTDWELGQLYTNPYGAFKNDVSTEATQATGSAGAGFFAMV